ncbi:hepatocyte growth factor receptor-like [Antedon mediterranea]|uniref:hepatocyte growth factor receptor-like n=1 Tax=Antedon mediterranea TaxID=105859 RepID=UPI003AF9753B
MYNIQLKQRSTTTLKKLNMLFVTLLICASVPSVYSRNIIAFTTREGDLNHIIVHNQTGRVYVGAVNGIFQLSNNMQFEFEYKTGPQLENVKCLPEKECSYFEAAKENINKILLIDYEKQFLLECGSAIQGTCKIHSLTMINPIEDHIYSSDNIEYDFVATEGSVVAFFGPAPPNQEQDSSLGLYVGATRQTERPDEYITQKAVSTKRLHLTNGRYNFQYAYYDDSSMVHSYIDLLPTYADEYKINYVHGFSHDGFSYFLTVQRRAVDSNSYETRIVRICQNDRGYYSYTEMPLKCENGNKTRNYNILQAAYFGPVGEDLTGYLELDDNDVDLNVILGVFAENVNRTTDVPSNNTAVCAFTMKMIATKFRKGIQKCYDGRDTQGLRFLSQDAVCMSSMATINNQFCGDSLNSPIQIGSSYSEIDLLQGGGRGVSLSSINAMTYDRRTIAVMGTKNGQLLHYILRERNEGRNPPPRGVNPPGIVTPYRNQTMDPPGPIIQDMPFSLDMESIYVGTPQNLFQVPINDCSQYPDCSTCVTTEDPIICGWCGDYCSSQNECFGAGVVWSQAACLPAIYEISPLSGPLGGGTELIISGDNLGVGVNMTRGTHAINLPGGVICTPIPEKSELHVITCITAAVDEPTKGIVTVSINVNSDLIPYTITGIALSEMTFSYVDPNIEGFNPPYGPISGGTNLQIYGSDLTAGNSRLIKIGGMECTIISEVETMATCITEGIPEMVSTSSEINIVFDTYTSKYSTEQYHYIDDPVITNMNPKISILSGGLPLNVYGSNLHIIMEPKIIVTVYLGTEYQEYNSPCTTNSNGTQMTCISPDISRSQVETPTEVDIAFILDNVDNAMQIMNTTANDTETDFDILQMTYVTDPIYYQFEDKNSVRQLKDNTYPLEIMGNHLNLAATRDDVQVKVDEQACNVTQLTNTVLTCQPPHFDQDTTEEHPVTVTVGNLRYEVGSLQYFGEVDTGPEYWHYILIAASSFIVIFVVILVLMLLYKRRMRSKYLEANEPAVHYRPEAYRVDPSSSNTNGTIVEEQNPLLNTPSKNSYTENPSFRQRENKSLLSVISAEMRLQIEEITIPEDNFVIETLIGKGHFGSVYQGSHKTQSGQVNDIAIKCLLPGSSQTEMVHFLEEGMIMKDFKHENVLALIGVCINKEGIPLVILPFMKHGDLLMYIRDPVYDLTARELLTFGLHIARGMSYLTGLKFVHRDLAARNCMLDETLTVKVADFGLSRDIYERDYYSAKDKNAKLPVRWMALECLERNIYNTKTDVWSFGVVLWELLTRGITPYPAVDNWDIGRFLAQGRRLPQPQFCPDEVYHVMQQCWGFSPQGRPNFEELSKKLSIILESSPASPTTKDTYVYVNVNVPRNESYTLATQNDPLAQSSFIPDGYMAMAGARSEEELAPTPYVETPIFPKIPAAQRKSSKAEAIQEDVQGYLQVSPQV